ncbi:MAG: tRNA pseudouridine(13) synthase TruD [Gammaproteobacteria bacterium]
MLNPDAFHLHFPYAYGEPANTGRLRTAPEDFFVEERLAFEPDGEGEHVLVCIEKRQLNTEDVARCLGKQFGLKNVDVSYAGMKDRNAVTRQWFSLTLPGRPTPESFELPAGATLLAVKRHSRKLKKGALKANDFVLRIQALQGGRDDIEARLHTIATQGVPNYFGEQRFGRARQNLLQADKLFAGALRAKRHQQGLYLSAARSWLFNLVLAERVRQGNWNQALAGDAFIFDDSLQYFVEEHISTETLTRLNDMQIHPSGPLWGRGQDFLCAEALQLEARLLAPYQAWCEALERRGLKQQRRSYRLVPQGLSYDWQSEEVLELRFSLPRGSYATSVMRELFVDNDTRNQKPGTEPSA